VTQLGSSTAVWAVHFDIGGNMCGLAEFAPPCVEAHLVTLTSEVNSLPCLTAVPPKGKRCAL
jgi:hypothetical protein